MLLLTAFIECADENRGKLRAEETARAIPVAVWSPCLLEESETLIFEH